MYKLFKNLFGETIIQRVTDGAFISTDESSPDYQKYLEWVAAGNTPLPADSQDLSENVGE